MAVIIDIIKIVPISSLIAKMKLLNIPITDRYSEPVANKPSKKIPAMQTKLVSRFITMTVMIRIMKIR
jgi:hypothetical protein